MHPTRPGSLRLQRIDRGLKHIQRARIVLFSAERLSVQDVARWAGVSRPAVRRWRRRYAEVGVEGSRSVRRMMAVTDSP